MQFNIGIYDKLNEKVEGDILEVSDRNDLFSQASQRINVDLAELLENTFFKWNTFVYENEKLKIFMSHHPIP